MNPEKTRQLQERFDLIKQVLIEKYGADAAMAAEAAAWMQVVQYLCKREMLHALQHPLEFNLTLAEKEVEAMLKGLHTQLCEHLKQKPEDSIHLAASFREVISDICYRKDDQ